MTTIIAIRTDEHVVIGADRQLTRDNGHFITYGNTSKIEEINGKIAAGAAGSVHQCDFFVRKLRKALKIENDNLHLAAARLGRALAKTGRQDIDEYRNVNLVAVDRSNIIVVGGHGDVIDDDLNLFAVGSGGYLAHAAALAYMDATPGETAEFYVRKALGVAQELCPYTNDKCQIVKFDRTPSDHRIESVIVGRRENRTPAELSVGEKE